MAEQKELLEQLESDLEMFDLIFLVRTDKERTEDLVTDFCTSKAVRNTDKKLLLLSSSKWRQHLREKSCTYRRITEAETRILLKLYSMYEFSDRFRVFPGFAVCGSLFEFFKS